MRFMHRVIPLPDRPGAPILSTDSSPCRQDESGVTAPPPFARINHNGAF